MTEIEVDVNVLQARLAPIGAVDVRKLAGGASSLTYLASTPSGDVVVKVAPAGLPAVRNRDVLRQARLLRALAGTGVPVPEVLHEDAGDPPLFVMSHVPGASLEPLFDGDGTEAPAVVAARMRHAARVLADLHRLSPGTLALGDEPVVGLADEIGRWTRLLETVDPSLAPGWDGVAASLLATQPPAMPSAIVHGDFRLGNLLARGPRVTAVIDWEIWSVGDPRVDLGWFLVNADPDTYRRRTGYAGVLPTPDELAAVYGDVADLDWFRALACFKSVATWSLIVKHNRRRTEPDPVAGEVAPVLPALLGRAAALVSSGGSR